MRKGVKIYTSHTIKEAKGKDCLEEVIITKVDPNFQTIEGTEKSLDVDVVCLAVGLNPAVELVKMSECELIHVPKLGGYVPLHNGNMQTTNPNIYVAGDISGIEEASTAMEEGRLAGISIASSLDLISEYEAKKIKDDINTRILDLRSGPHGISRKESKNYILRRYETWTANM
jgi:thioredoxin reductase